MNPPDNNSNSAATQAEPGGYDFTPRPVSGRMPGQVMTANQPPDTNDLAALLGTPPGTKGSQIVHKNGIQTKPPRKSLPLGPELQGSFQVEPIRLPAIIPGKGSKRRLADEARLAATLRGEFNGSLPVRRSCRVVTVDTDASDFKPRPVRKGAGKGPRNWQPQVMRF